MRFYAHVLTALAIIAASSQAAAQVPSGYTYYSPNPNCGPDGNCYEVGIGPPYRPCHDPDEWCSAPQDDPFYPGMVYCDSSERATYAPGSSKEQPAFAPATVGSNIGLKVFDCYYSFVCGKRYDKITGAFTGCGPTGKYTLNEEQVYELVGSCDCTPIITTVPYPDPTPDDGPPEGYQQQYETGPSILEGGQQ